jgi:Protein of unknown function (DUF2680)
MDSKMRNKIVAGAATLVAVAGGGAAIAATGALSPQQESEAIVNDVAEQLGVEPEELTDALKEAQKNRVDAAVEAGRLTEEQGEELKARIESSDSPLLGFGPRPGHGHGVHFHDLDAAASYLDMTEDELRTALTEGQTLAEIAEARDKPVDGLIDALVAAASEDLDQAVEDGRLTEEQKEEILSTLEERITARVNGERGPGAGWRRFGPPPQPESEDSGSTQTSTSLA